MTVSTEYAKWIGDASPVPGDTLVDVLLRGGVERLNVPASELSWGLIGLDNDIAYWRVAKDPNGLPNQFFPPIGRGFSDHGEPVDEDEGEDRLTIRDSFAIAAMQGLLSDPDITGGKEEFAKHAYEMADAMLAERKNGGAA